MPGPSDPNNVKITAILEGAQAAEDSGVLTDKIISDAERAAEASKAASEASAQAAAEASAKEVEAAGAVGAAIEEQRVIIGGATEAERSSFQQLIAALTTATDAAAGIAPAVDEAAAAAARIGSAAPAVESLSEAFKVAQAAIEELAVQGDASSAEFGKGIAASVDRARAALIALEEAMKAAAASPGGVSPEQIALAQKLELEYQKGAISLREYNLAQLEAGRGARDTEPHISSLGESLSRLTLYAKLYIATKLFSAFSSLEEKVKDAALAMERIDRTLLQATGSQEKANEEWEFFKQTAEKLGLPLKELADSYARLEVAAKPTTLTTRELRTLFTGLGEAAIVFGRDSGALNTAMLAIQKSVDGGIVQMQTFKRQLENAMPGAFDIAAKAFGYGRDQIDEFDKALKSGAISGEELVRRFGPALIATFQTSLPSAVNSTQAAFNRLDNEIFIAQAGIAQQLTPALKDALTTLDNFLKNNPEVISGLGKIGSAVVELGGMFTKSFDGMGDSSKTVIKWMADLAFLIPKVANLFIKDFEETVATAKKLPASFHLITDEIRETFTEAQSYVVGTQYSVLAVLSLYDSSFAAAANSALRELKNLGAQQKQIALDMARDHQEAAARVVAAVDLTIGALQGSLPAFDAVGAAIHKGVKDIEDYAKEIGLVGPVEQAAADKIVKEINKQIKAIGQLPAAQQAAYESTIQELEKFQHHYEVFTSAYEKLKAREEKAAQAAAKAEAAALRQRMDAYEKFYKGLQALVDKADKSSEVSLKKAQDKLAADLAELNKLQGQGTLSGEEVNRLNELRDSLGKTTAEVARLTAAEKLASSANDQFGGSADRAGNDLRKFVTDAIANDQHLRDDIAKLPAASKDAFGRMVQNLAELKDQGLLTEDALRRFGVDSAAIFKAAGIATSDLAQRLGLVSRGSGDLRREIDALTPSVKEQQSEEAKLAKTSDDTAAATAKLTHATEALGGGYIQAHRDADGLADGSTNLAHQFEIVGGAAKDTDQILLHVGDSLVNVKAVTQEAGTGFIQMGDRVVEIGKKSTDAATDLDKVGKSTTETKKTVDEVADALGKATPHLIDLGEAAKKADEGTKDLPAAISGTADAATKAVDPFSQLSRAFAEIGKGKIVEIFSRLGTVLETDATSLDALASSVHALEDVDIKRIEDLTKAVAELVKQVVLLANGAGALRAALAGIPSELEATKELFVAIEKIGPAALGAVEAAA